VAEGYGQNSVALLGALAAVTERIGLGAGILQIPARQPATTAMAAASLDRISGGRMLLGLALYIGGMGARGANFHHDVFARTGHAELAVRIQDLYLSGAKHAAAAAIPRRLVEEVALIGPRAKIRDDLARWEDTVIDSINAELPMPARRDCNVKHRPGQDPCVAVHRGSDFLYLFKAAPTAPLLAQHRRQPNAPRGAAASGRSPRRAGLPEAARLRLT
jgi:alkanesulfonate monooxygenase SsuD/methylene tetrahydromethanopterin reductase-like flavin-dependent oxidoreductase (luciferase family)